MNKTPSGFRAVRMRGKSEVVYCVERKGKVDSCCTTSGSEIDVYSANGGKITMNPRSFFASYVSEYSPMPDSVRSMFQGKPTFTEWWAARNQKENAA